MNLEAYSLEAPGKIIDNDPQDFPSSVEIGAEDAERELARRLDHSKVKAKGLFEFHAAAFAKNPSAKHWSELVAMMYIHQSLVAGSLKHVAKD